MRFDKEDGMLILLSATIIMVFAVVFALFAPILLTPLGIYAFVHFVLLLDC